MRIQIITPQIEGVRTGNRSSADQWEAVMLQLGHEVEISSQYGGERIDWLIALHALKSSAAVAECRQCHPEAKIALVLTGTDIYPGPSPAALESMRLADRLIGLQPNVAQMIPADLHHKLRVIVQASSAVESVEPKSLSPFDVCVVGHLRDVKDPMLTAQAARLLPDDSKIRVLHAGGILDAKYEALVALERRENPRYCWLGHLEVTAVRQLIADSQLLVLTSISEGAGRVIGSAISKGTPVLSTRIHGVVGLVGDDYPGLFPVGDAGELARLMGRAEREQSFREDLATACAARADLFSPERELATWRELLDGTVERC